MRYTHNPVELQLRVSLLLGLFKNDIITSACDLIGPKHKNRSRMIRIRTWERWRKDLNSAGHTHANAARIKRQIRANSTPHMPHAHTRTCDGAHTHIQTASGHSRQQKAKPQKPHQWHTHSAKDLIQNQCARLPRYCSPLP